MNLVYNRTPEIEYDPSRGASTAGDPRIEYCPHRVWSTAQGFGVAVKMLDGHPPIKHPWLTVELMQKEFAIDKYQRDRVQVFMDSLE